MPCSARPAGLLISVVLALVGGLVSASPAWSDSDTTAPGTPRSVVVTPRTAYGRLAITWAPASDDVGVTQYRVYVSAAPGAGTSVDPVGATPSTRWVTRALVPGAWVVQVVAVDAAGNVGPPSTAVTTTLGGVPASAGNLLTVEQASIETSLTGVETSGGGVVYGRSTRVAAHGVASLAARLTTTGGAALRTSRGWTPVAAGAAYGAVMVVRTPASVAPGHRVLVRILWWDSWGRQIARSDGPWTVVGSRAWGHVAATGKRAPVGAVSASESLVVERSAVGDTYYSDEWGLFRATGWPRWTLPAAAAGPVVVVLGDSYEQGSGGTGPFASWSSLYAAQRGWRELNLSRGGTGYATDRLSTNCPPAACSRIPGMVTMAAAAAPAVVVVAGGRNDIGLVPTDPAAVRAGIDATVSALRSRLPRARIVVVSPMWGDSSPPTDLLTMSGWVSSACTTYSVTCVTGAESWLDDHGEWMNPDRIHPNDLGYEQIAARMLGATP